MELQMIKNYAKIILLKDIRKINTRRFIHRRTAFEVILKSGYHYLINCYSESYRQEAVSLLQKY